LLNLSGKIDEGTIALLSIVDQVANQVSVPYLVIGATARDMVMHYGYGAPVQRATTDLDFAIQLPDWETYTLVTGQLIDQGFKQGGSPQRERLYDIDGLMERYDWDIDIGSAHLLGIDAAEISNAQTKLQIVGILNKNFDAGTPNFLAEEMCNRVNDEYTDRLNRLQAFFNGFRRGQKQSVPSITGRGEYWALVSLLSRVDANLEFRGNSGDSRPDSIFASAIS